MSFTLSKYLPAINLGRKQKQKQQQKPNWGMAVSPAWLFNAQFAEFQPQALCLTGRAKSQKFAFSATPRKCWSCRQASHLTVRCCAHSSMREHISHSASQRRRWSSSSITRSWTHSWLTLCYIPFLVQFNGEPLTRAIFTSHQTPCLPYGEATVLRDMVQHFSTASLRAGHVYSANVEIAVFLFILFLDDGPQLWRKPHRRRYSTDW